MKLKRKILVLISLVLSAFLLFYAFRGIEVWRVFRIIKNTLLLPFLIGIAAYIFSFVLDVSRGKLILEQEGFNVGFISYALVNFLTLGLNKLLPFKLGETYRVMSGDLLSVPKKRLIFLSYLLKVASLVSVLVLAVLFLPFQIRLEGFVKYLMVSMILLFGLFATMFLFLKKNSFFDRIVDLPIIRRLKVKIKKARRGIRESMSYLEKTTILEVVLLSSLIWLFQGVSLYFFAVSLGIEASFLFIFSLRIFSILVSFVPITPEGLGLVELYLMKGLSFTSQNLASATVLLFRFFNYWVFLLLMPFLFLLKKEYLFGQIEAFKEVLGL